MPKINLDTKVKNLDGSDGIRVAQTLDDNNKPIITQTKLTARHVVGEALINGFEGQDVTTKLANGELAYRIAGNEGEQEFSAKDIVRMKEAVGKNCGPLLVHQLFNLIEPEPKSQSSEG